MARNSQQDQDAVDWQTVGLRLGTLGLDLRQPSGSGSLTKLLNARFLDEQNIARRDGHLSYQAQDASDYPTFNSTIIFNHAIGGPITPIGWTYGHGQRLSPTNANATGSEHLPAPLRGQSTFRFRGNDVVWTGDRLLQMRTDGLGALGGSLFWGDNSATKPLAYGHPAYLPSQADSSPCDTILGEHVQTCLTSTVRVVASSGSAVTTWITNRATGALVLKATLGGGTSPVDIRLFQSGAAVVCLWRDFVSANLYISSWLGSTWSVASVIDSGVNAFEVAPVAGGFHLAYRTTAALWISHYVGGAVTDQPYTHKTSIPTVTTPNGPTAIGVAPSGMLYVVWAATTGLYARVYDPLAGFMGAVVQISATTTWDGGLSVAIRGVPFNGSYPCVVHAGSGTTVRTIEFVRANPTNVTRTDTKFNSVMTSRSFVVGNEVFCWLRATNANTAYLLGGAARTLVCGYADREEAGSDFAVIDASIRPLPMVNPDPLDATGTQFTWIRPYHTGQTYTHPGNVRIGDLNFLPPLSVAHFGRSVYLSGSSVRNWDGVALGDTGFQSFPVVNSSAPAGGGSPGLTALGVYEYRVYAVRYNAQGERFQSAARVYTAPTLTGTDNKLTLTIATLPDTNHSDVVFEVYRTKSTLSAFFLEGTVANDLTAATVSFVSQLDDGALGLKLGDPHATGVGNIVELEEFGPLGCTILAVAGDRLFGAGGQVPRGQVQFSKLKENGEGVGFDDLAGTQDVDSQGGDITSIVGYNDAIVVFQKERLYMLAGTGPDNFGVGTFSVPQIVLADGATTHAGTAVIQAGVLYWGDNGPRILQPNFRVENISAPIHALTGGMVPSGVQVDLSRQEVVWYTSSGDAVLWNYRGSSRWAQWNGLPIAGCSEAALVTTDGRLLIESPDAVGDGGLRFEFVGRTGELRPGTMLGGATLLRSVGFVGSHDGDHTMRVRVHYNGSPLWTDEWTWQPDTGTWLGAGSDFATLTPAQVDALLPTDHSGQYATHKRVTRQNCRHFTVEWSDTGAVGPTFTPYELSLELGAMGGLGRVPVNTFGK